MYFTLKNVDEVVTLVRGQLFQEEREKEGEDDEEDEDHWASLGKGFERTRQTDVA